MGDHGCRLEASSYREFADAIAVVGLEEPAGVFAVARNGAGRLLALRACEKGGEGNVNKHHHCFDESVRCRSALAPYALFCRANVTRHGDNKVTAWPLPDCFVHVV